MSASAAAASAASMLVNVDHAVAISTSAIDLDRLIRIKEEAWDLERIADEFSTDEERITGRIYLPVGQREWAWKHKRGNAKMEKLIDSLMHNYPIPSSIVNEVEYRYQIYDGRHRMETIWRFKNNQFTWSGKYYRDLSDSDKDKFNRRTIPVTIIFPPRGSVVSSDQLADIFIRLNSGKQLTDSDMLWAYRDAKVMQGVRRLILENQRLRAIFGNNDMQYRPDLANWTAYYCGLGTNNSGNFTTSYIRISQIEEEGLQGNFDEEAVEQGIDALCSLYEGANATFPASTKDLRKYKKIGFVNAFFLAEWMAAEEEGDKEDVIEKWSDIIGRLRGEEETALRMRFALHTTGAQNLTTKKIKTVLGQINRYLENDEVDEVEESDDDSS